MVGHIDDFGSHDEDEFRQYRTTNTVDTTSVQNICITPTAGFASNALSMQALDLAITHYNEQGLQFTMARDGAGCNAGTADAVITANLDNSGGGVSGFPSGGLPYFEFYIGQSIASNYGVSVAAHVIQHELGHCIGFRHTDYYDRSISCGGGPSDEGDGGVGAIHIPGTPTDAVMNGSVMNACYNGGSNGIWTASDIVALDCLYDSGSCAPAPPPSYDTSLASLSNLSGGRRENTYYGPYDATGYDALRVSMSGGSGDADLYVTGIERNAADTGNARPRQVAPIAEHGDGIDVDGELAGHGDHRAWTFADGRLFPTPTRPPVNPDVVRRQNPPRRWYQAGRVRNARGMPMPTISVTSGGSSSWSMATMLAPIIGGIAASNTVI